jgi:membrane protein DedA with SNARE-associated domain
VAAKMVDKHNQEYGFARNLAGLRWLLIGFSLAGTFGCASAWRFQHGSVMGCIISCGLLTYAIVMFFWLPNYVERAGAVRDVFATVVFFWLPNYVERAGDRYAESIFSIPALSGAAKSRAAKTE